MEIGNKLTDRYEVKQTLGHGRMGVVYWAYDTRIKRDVAVKTIRDVPEPAALERFYKDCSVLASIGHPNIVEILEVGKFQDEGVEKTYFVMPLLKGVTLDNLIRQSSRRLTVERTIGILLQTCRGLQVAHEHGLVHGDLKPSNIFILEDDTVRIIDFGVVQLAEGRTASPSKGTLLYMSPEQIQLKPASALSDIFTLGVVAYEALTLRRPFDGATEGEIATSVLKYIPPPASDLNAAVSALLGRVVHKTMAKQPGNRFSTALELSEALAKALRNEPIEAVDSAKIQPRLDRAVKAFEAGDLQVSCEILTEIESEGHVLPEMAPLRRRIDTALRQNPLAAQKVQEAPNIDPENAEALRMHSDIQPDDSARQVDEWFGLARQHLDRFAFRHAREAVDNVLAMRPGDPQALGLAAEIKRREQQYVQVRQEKEKLYRSAVDAYEKAELSTALSKLERVLELDRGAPEISSTEGAVSYQSFYDQVRSEQDAILASYAEARRALVEGNFVRAMEITEESLKKHPGQALFQALRLDIEDRKRQKLSAFIAEVDRNVEAEPDVDRRADILRSALEQFPGEQHFERALRLTLDKRDLVNSIAASAQRLEDEEQFSDALSQWEILRTVYPQFPGLDVELERLSKRGEQQRCDETREFPGDAEFEHVSKLINQGEERNAGTQALVDQGRAMRLHGRFEEAESLFRQAYEKDERNAIVRTLLVETLVQHAHSVVENNSKYAGELVESALKIDPSHLQARRVAMLVSERKRDEAVDMCVSRARQLQASGDVPGALAAVEALLATYPNGTRLVQLKAILQRDSTDAAATQTRRSDLEKLTALEFDAEHATDPEKQRQILAAVRELAARHLDDPDFQRSLVKLEKRFVGLNRSALAELPKPLEKKVAASVSATPPPLPPPVPLLASPETRDFAEVPAPSETRGGPVPPFPPGQKPAARGAKFWGAFAASFAVVAALGGGFIWWQQRSTPKPKSTVVSSAGDIPVDVHTVPEGATIVVNDKPSGTSSVQLKLAPGTYRINAVREGYRPSQTTVTVSAGHPVTTSITLQPMPTTLRLLTDFSAASISFDGKPQSNLQSGQLILDSIAAGSHLLTIGTGAAGISVRFDARDGGPPVVTSLEAGKDTSAILISNLGGKARVYSSQKTGTVVFDGKPTGSLDPLGVELANLGPGDHEITIGEGDARRKVVYQTAQVPALTLYLNSLVQNQRAVGTLLITTGEDDVQITIDGKPVRGATRRGQMRIPNLPPKQYTIAASKEGFQPVPEQRVTINKGDEAKVAFKMTPLPAIATLHLTGGVPGTQVAVDGKPTGTVGQDGSMAAVQVSPGTHTVLLRRDEYKSKTFQLDFGAGKDVILSGGDVALQPTFGTLTVAVTPAGAQVTVQHAGEPARPFTGSSMHLAEGSYTVTAAAPKFATQSTTVQIATGSTKNVTLQLAAERVAPPKAVARLGMSGWQFPAAWTPEGDHFTRKGGNLCLYSPQGPGTYAFTATMKHGKQLRWVAHVINDKNYVEFELDNENFYRRQVMDGKGRELVKRKHGLKMDSAVSATIQCIISPAGIVQKLQRPDGWVNLDSWMDPALHEGRFGFLIKGRDEVNLSAFWFAGSAE
jgi:serine/threonine protein kinase